MRSRVWPSTTGKRLRRAPTRQEECLGAVSHRGSCCWIGQLPQSWVAPDHLLDLRSRVRIAAYAGLRRGELLALRWRDVDFAGHAVTVGRAMSAGIESSTESGRVRRACA